MGIQLPVARTKRSPATRPPVGKRSWARLSRITDDGARVGDKVSELLCSCLAGGVVWKSLSPSTGERWASTLVVSLAGLNMKIV